MKRTSSILRNRSQLKYYSTGNYCPNDLRYYASSGSWGYPSADTLASLRSTDWVKSWFRESAKSRATYLSTTNYIGKSSMIDVAGNRSDWNYCSHQTLRAVNRPFAYCYQGMWGVTYAAGFWRQAWPVNMSEPDNEYSIPRLASFLQDQEFSARAYWTMRPRFEGDVSLINSIFELKDFKDVLKNIGKFGNLFVKLNEHRKQLSGLKTEIRLSTKGISAPDPTRAIAEGWLTKVLAIDPTIRDFLAISAQAMTSARAAQQAYKQDGIDGKISHYRERLMSTNQTTPGYNNNLVWGTGSSSSLVRNANMYYTYGYTDRSTVDAICTYWGLTGTVEALWNMLPLSFVIDYFLTVGKALHMARIDNNTSIPSVLRYCESATYKSSYGQHFLLLPCVNSFCLDDKAYLGGSNEPLLVSGIERKNYLRTPMDPYKGPALPRVKLPSSKQMTTMAALLRCMI